MAEQNKKKKSGLHKEISSIFDGVPVPSHKGPAGSQGTPPGLGQGKAAYDSPRPIRAPQNPQIPGSQNFNQPGGPAAAARPKTGQADQAANAGPLRRMTRKLFAPKPGVNPRKQKMMLLLIPLLAVVLLILGRKNLDFIFSKPAATVKQPTGNDTTAIAKMLTGIDWTPPEPFPTGLRDPMQLTPRMVAQIDEMNAEKVAVKPPENTGTIDPDATKAGELTVKGILFSDDNPAAIVGTEGNILHVGDVVAGAKILKITRNAVEFEKDGEKWIQTVEP